MKGGERKALVVAPFWRLTGHVGVYRVARFVRWLHGAGLEIVLVRAGSTDGVEPAPWGIEISVRDPIGLYRDPNGAATPAWRRGRSSLRRFAALTLFSPDATIVWAHRASRHPTVLAAAAGAQWVLASSPPESVHVAAVALAGRLGAKLIVDLRDGWLDEPNKPFMDILPLRRWHERRLEAHTLRRADRIVVTSEGWRRQLSARCPDIAPRVHVLTNGYPVADPEGERPRRERATQPQSRPVLELLYTGQFMHSRGTQRPRLLLEPLRLAAQRGVAHANIELIGNLSSADLKEIATWSTRLAAVGWGVRVRPSVPRPEALALLRTADGLLLLSASEGAIPSKVFEYLPAGRPILAVTSPTGALWEVCRDIPQVFLADDRHPERSLPVVTAFLEASADRGRSYPLPQQFSESTLRGQFLAIMGLGAVGG